MGYTVEFDRTARRLAEELERVDAVLEPLKKRRENKEKVEKLMRCVGGVLPLLSHGAEICWSIDDNNVIEVIMAEDNVLRLSHYSSPEGDNGERGRKLEVVREDVHFDGGDDVVTAKHVEVYHRKTILVFVTIPDERLVNVDTLVFGEDDDRIATNGLLLDNLPSICIEHNVKVD